MEGGEIIALPPTIIGYGGKVLGTSGTMRIPEEWNLVHYSGILIVLLGCDPRWLDTFRIGPEAQQMATTIWAIRFRAFVG